MFNPKKRVPATVEFADIAAPAAGGAQALVDVAAYKNADALVHVVRAFRDEAVRARAGSVNPARDAQAMEDELILADLGVAERRLERIEKDLKKRRRPSSKPRRALMTALPRGARKGHAAARAGAGRRRPEAASRLPVPLGEAAAGRHQPRRSRCRRRRRPASSSAAEKTGLTAFLSRAATRAVAVCAKIELEIARARAGRRRRVPGGPRASRSPASTASSARPTICSATCRSSPSARTSAAPGRSRADTIAQLAAGEIHSDIARGFIRAEVVAYDALVARGSLAACRDHGELRLEGKEYVVADGDIINFRHAT